MDHFKQASFSLTHPPQWHCPTCEIGILQLEGDFNHQSTATTKRDADHPEFSHEWVEYTIHGQLQCNNSRCNEPVMLIGTGFVEEESCYESTTSEYLTYCTPTYFQPHLKIFNIPDYVPSKVSEMLDKSFALFFCDSDSCGNKIRAGIEVLLDELSVKKTEFKGGKDKIISLGNRINNELGNQHQDIKKLIDAIRWLGNASSHGADNLTKNDIIEAYKIIQVVLKIKFEPGLDMATISNIAEKMINKHK